MFTPGSLFVCYHKGRPEVTIVIINIICVRHF